MYKLEEMCPQEGEEISLAWENYSCMDINIVAEQPYYYHHECLGGGHDHLYFDLSVDDSCLFANEAGNCCFLLHTIQTVADSETMMASPTAMHYIFDAS